MPRGAKNGHPKMGGRKKGTPNKVTASVKAALTEAFDKLGGVDALVTWGKENPNGFYTIWARMLPSQASADTTNEILAGLLRDCIKGDVDDGTTTGGPPQHTGGSGAVRPAEPLAEPPASERT